MLETLTSMARAVTTAAATRAVAVAAHETAHWAAARLLGKRAHVSLHCGGIGASCTLVPGLSHAPQLQRAFVRHAGWVFSVALAIAVTVRGMCTDVVVLCTLWLVAIEALTSDLLLWRSGELFHCGNFGLLLLDQAGRGRIQELLRTMLRVTMMRGAQSAGLVRQAARASERERERTPLPCELTLCCVAPCTSR